MTLRGLGKAVCPETGLAIPECSCKACLEAMLRQFHPGPMDGPITITKVSATSRSQNRRQPRH